MAAKAVLDASALIALLQGESGAEVVKAYLEGAALVTVNLTEVADYYFKQRGSRARVEAAVRELSIAVIPTDFTLAMDAGELLLPTRPAGLSLADRYCLALAKRLGRVAVTADRAWARVAEATAIDIKLIR